MSGIDTDVLVIGAGPAGAVAAYYAAERGANVLIIDKKSDIGVPVRCGEGIPMSIFDDFGLSKSKEWLVNRAKYIKFVSPKGNVIEVEPHITPCVLNRDKFEQMLVRRAEKKGVKVMLRTMAVNGRKDKKGIMSVDIERYEGDDKLAMQVRPSIIIAADGVESRIGRWVGIRTRINLNDIATCAQYTVEHDSIDGDTLEFWLGQRYARTGYAWVFPKGKDTANIGVGMLAEKGSGPMNICDGFLRLRADGCKKGRFTVGCIPMSKPVEQSVKGNVMLVGDAARLVVPLTGAGVANAIISGRMAGTCAGKVATGGKDLESLKDYDIRWRKALERKLLKSYGYRKKVEVSDKKLERFLRTVRMVFGLYRLAPRFFSKRLMGDFHYTGVDEEDS